MNKHKLVLLLPLLLLAAALIPAVVQANGGTTVTLSPTADSYVYEGDVNQNYGTAVFVECQWADLGSLTHMYAFLMFDLSTIPTGSSIVSANLILHDTEGNGNAGVAAYRVDGGWTELGITWANMPSVESTISASYPHDFSGLWIFDVKNDVQSFVSGGAVNHGWLLAIGSNWRTFVSKESADVNSRPVLQVTYGPGLPVPEYAFGALLAMVGCFAAFVIIKKPHLNLRIK